MAEKTGNTGKLIYDFNTAGHLEVFMPNLDGWYRVTARDFRSFDGKRRITEPSYTEKSTVSVPMVTNEYNGPVYLWGTNTLVEDATNEGKLITSAYWDSIHKISGSRG